MLVIPTLQFGIFYIGTNINSFALSFQRYEYGEFVFNGWNNFARVFTNIANDPEVGSAIKNSFLIYGIGLLESIPVSVLFAYYIYKKFFGFKIFKLLLFLPSLLSILTLCVLYRYFADQAIPEVLQKLFGVKVTGLFSNVNTEFFALLFAFVFFSMGSTLLLYLGAVSGVSSSSVGSLGDRRGKQLDAVYPRGSSHDFSDDKNLFYQRNRRIVFQSVQPV